MSLPKQGAQRGLLVVPPITITQAMCQPGDIAVPTPGVDPEVWSNKAWAKGDLCCVPAKRRVYKRLVDGTTNTSPENDATNWLDYAAINADLMLDQVIGTQTASAVGQALVRVIKPGKVITAIALLNVVGVKVTIAMSDPSGETWLREFDLISTSGVNDWFAWHFKLSRRKRQVLCLDVPPYSDATWTITITPGPGEQAKCGVLLMGYGESIGRGLQWGPSIGRVNYSELDFDKFGNGNYVSRAVARRAKFQVQVDNSDIDWVDEFINSYPAQNLLWIGYEGLACTVLYGICEDFNIVVPHQVWSDCDFNLRGVT